MGPDYERVSALGQPHEAWHEQDVPHAQVSPQQQPVGVGSQAQGVGQVQAAIAISSSVDYGS